MRLDDDRTFAASVAAFRDATARAADGRATRARVLIAAGARQRRRALLRRSALGLAVVVVVVALSGSAAWTALGHWRGASTFAPPVESASVERPVALGRAVAAPAPVVALTIPVPSSVTRASSRADEEARAYGRAHEAHFVTNEPRAALELWDRYLGRYPRGTFAPEARFNRALCLLRVGRPDEAVEALRPFAAGAYGGYRQREAATLIDWTVVGRER